MGLRHINPATDASVEAGPDEVRSHASRWFVGVGTTSVHPFPTAVPPACISFNTTRGRSWVLGPAPASSCGIRRARRSILRIVDSIHSMGAWSAASATTVTTRRSAKRRAESLFGSVVVSTARWGREWLAWPPNMGVSGLSTSPPIARSHYLDARSVFCFPAARPRISCRRRRVACDRHSVGAGISRELKLARRRRRWGRYFLRNLRLLDFRNHRQWPSAKIAKNTGAITINPIASLCDDSVCPVLTPDGGPMYKDDNHINPAYVKQNVRYLDSIVRLE